MHIKNTAKTAPFKTINLHKLTIMNTNSAIFTNVSFCDYERLCRVLMCESDCTLPFISTLELLNNKLKNGQFYFYHFAKMESYITKVDDCLCDHIQESMSSMILGTSISIGILIPISCLLFSLFLSLSFLVAKLLYKY